MACHNKNPLARKRRSKTKPYTPWTELTTPPSMRVPNPTETNTARKFSCIRSCESNWKFLCHKFRNSEEEGPEHPINETLIFSHVRGSSLTEEVSNVPAHCNIGRLCTLCSLPLLSSWRRIEKVEIETHLGIINSMRTRYGQCLMVTPK